MGSPKPAGCDQAERAVRTTADAGEFVAMVEQAASGDTQRNLRLSIASENAWPVRVDALMRLLRKRMPSPAGSSGVPGNH